MNSEFTSVVESSRRRLLVLVRNIVGDSAMAEDIVQDTVLAGLRAVNEGKDVTVLKPGRNRILCGFGLRIFFCVRKISL